KHHNEMDRYPLNPKRIYRAKIGKKSAVKKTFKVKKAKKKYYVRVRTYKTVKGKKIYSSWSKAKVLKTKR
ncbi:MAG: hypothetical protein UDF26_03880, partial [Clostridia bacterium]|nr:hypothetical protein [Clostridia bacterium]